MTHTMILSKQQLEQVQKTGSVPCEKCDMLMALFPADLFVQGSTKYPHATKSPELYCSKCRISAPLFKR